jgi:ABC-type nitrate/sulfonate/bicarbonate transport system substrate-binding protein
LQSIAGAVRWRPAPPRWPPSGPDRRQRHYEPSATQAIERGAAERLSSADPYPNQQMAVLLYGADFIEKQPQLAQKFMIAYLKGARFSNDALKGASMRR